jgi:hypothetical protein
LVVRFYNSVLVNIFSSDSYSNDFGFTLMEDAYSVWHYSIPLEPSTAQQQDYFRICTIIAKPIYNGATKVTTYSALRCMPTIGM